MKGVRAKEECSLDRFAAVARLADDLQVRLGLEDLAKARADERLVVRDQNLDRHAGSRARTVKPRRRLIPLQRPGIESSRPAYVVDSSDST